MARTLSHQGDALLAIEHALTPAGHETFDAYVRDHWPRLVGATPADVLEITTSYDMFLSQTEPFCEAHDAALSGLQAVTPALHALIILARELTMANLIKLLTAAGLMPEDDLAIIEEEEPA